MDQSNRSKILLLSVKFTGNRVQKYCRVMFRLPVGQKITGVPDRSEKTKLLFVPWNTKNNQSNWERTNKNNINKHHWQVNYESNNTAVYRPDTFSYWLVATVLQLSHQKRHPSDPQWPERKYRSNLMGEIASLFFSWSILI